MNRRNRTALVLMLAVSLAALATYGVFRTIKSIPVRQVEVATKYVVVAAENMPLGTRVAKEQVKAVGWPAATPVEGSFDSVETVIGRGLIEPLAVNEPLTERKLAPKEAGAGLSPSIPPGMRALSVRVNDVIGVAGFTVPGARVDVVVVLKDRENSMARAVVSNLQVLTAGTKYDIEQAKDGKPMPSTVVTLLVSPDDAERIALAQTEGSITLVLRNPLDVTPTETRGVRMAGLFGAPAPEPVGKPVQRPRKSAAAAPVAEPPPPPAKQVYNVESIRAGKRTVERAGKRTAEELK
jgi:pilus assembly protein CpaB